MQQLEKILVRSTACLLALFHTNSCHDMISMSNLIPYPTNTHDTSQGKFKSQSQITRIVWSPNSNSFYTVRKNKGKTSDDCDCDVDHKCWWSGGSAFQCIEHLQTLISPNQIDAEGQAAVQQNVVPKHLTPPYGDIVRLVCGHDRASSSVGNGYMQCALLCVIIAGSGDVDSHVVHTV